jgi:hypothetical protein
MPVLAEAGEQLCIDTRILSAFEGNPRTNKACHSQT